MEPEAARQVDGWSGAGRGGGREGRQWAVADLWLWREGGTNTWFPRPSAVETLLEQVPCTPSDSREFGLEKIKLPKPHQSFPREFEESPIFLVFEE